MVMTARAWAAGVSGQLSSRMVLIVPSCGAASASVRSAASSVATRRQLPSAASSQRAGSPARAALPATPAVTNASTCRSSKPAGLWTAYAMLAAVPMTAVRSAATPISAQTAR